MNSPASITNNYTDIAEAKTKLPLGKMLVLGIFAGAFIAFGAIGSQIAAFGVQPAALGRMLSAAVFPIGLMLVLIAGAELFTGNCLIIVSVLEKRATLSGLLRNWLFVYLGNLIGGVAVAALAVYGHVFDMYNCELAKVAVTTAVSKVNLDFLDAFIKGILCNVLVCGAVWVSFAADELAGKVLALFLPVSLFVLCGFEHCVANMYFVPAGILSSIEYKIPIESIGAVSFMGYDVEGALALLLKFLYKNLLPVTLGNIFGGAIILGLGYWFVYYQSCRDK